MNNFKDLFDIKSMNQEDNEDFMKFFDVHDMEPLFTNAHRTQNISVAWTDIRNVNSRGRYFKTMSEFSDVMQTSKDNQMYTEAIFDIISTTRSFQKMIDNMDKFLNYIYTEIEDRHQFNKWNVVFYTQVVK